MTEPSYLPLFTGVEVCKLESSAKQYATYYNFYFNETELIPMDCVHKCSGHMHCSHKKEVPEQGFQIDLVHIVTCLGLLYCT